MTTRWMLTAAFAASLAAGAPVLAQFNRPGIPSCPGDTSKQIDDRSAALDAVHQIVRGAHRYKMLHGMYPTWQQLAETPPLRLRGEPDVKWGTDEPVSDWRIHFVGDSGAYVFTLTGTKDRCHVTFVGDDSGRILDGRELGPRYGVVPLGTR